MKVLNTEKEDYHVHSFNFSDGMSTIDEIVKFAGEIGMKKVVITDHSQAAIDAHNEVKKAARSLIKAERWVNVFNDVKVSFGVEADLLDEEGNICDHIQKVKGDFIILSYHYEVFKGDKKKVTQAFIKAIEAHHDKINCIGHIYAFVKDTGIDITKVVACANKYKIPLEFNCRYLTSGKHMADHDAMKLMLSKADSIYVNSDAHTLWEFRELRKKGFEFLQENGFLK
jgi:histidinol phosphatase-like PHP family hydrolase